MKHNKIEVKKENDTAIEFSPMVDAEIWVEVGHEAEGRRITKEIVKVWNSHDEMVTILEMIVSLDTIKEEKGELSDEYIELMDLCVTSADIVIDKIKGE